MNVINLLERFVNAICPKSNCKNESICWQRPMWCIIYPSGDLKVQKYGNSSYNHDNSL